MDRIIVEKDPAVYTNERWSEENTWVNCLGCGRFIRHEGLFCRYCKLLKKELAS